MFYPRAKIEFGLRTSVEWLSQRNIGGEGMTTCKSLNMDLIQQASTTQWANDLYSTLVELLDIEDFLSRLRRNWVTSHED